MASNCFFGAIRWDAWYSSTVGAPAIQTQKSLSQQKWQFRAPIHMPAVSSSALTAPSKSQAIMDAEILAAKAGGLKYWAYLLYSRTPFANVSIGMMDGFDLHQSSTIKDQINWCMIQQTGLFATSSGFSIAQMVAWMQQSNYQKVLTNRPLVYIFWSDADLASAFGGSLAAFKTQVDALRSAAQAAGLGNPYIVVQNGAEVSVYNGIGADAVSNYISPTAPVAINDIFPSLATLAQNYWTTLAGQGVPIVPICMTGWDTRPRKERPPPWETTSRRPRFGLNAYFQAATNAELATHLQAAVTYINANPSICPSQAALIYAWNECDEGGGALTPTIGDPTGARLTAIAPVIA